MSLERDDVESKLSVKGFRLQDDRDHRFYWLHIDEAKQAIYTKVSTGTKYRTLGNDLVLAMARQVRLTTKEFRQLVECSLTAEGYLELLRARGHLKGPRKPIG